MRAQPPQNRLLAVAILSALSFGCNRGPAPTEAPPASESGDHSMAPALRATDNGFEVIPDSQGMDPRAGAAHPSAMMPAGHAPASAQAPTGPPIVGEDSPSLAGLRWQVQEPLQWRQPSRPMRNGEYIVAGSESVLTVFHFPGMGGDLRANVTRWVGQFRNAEGQPMTLENASVEDKTIAGLPVTTVDVQGTFATSMGSDGTPQQNSRLLGAIVTGPQGPVFFKLVGDAESVGSAAEAFSALVASFEATE